MDERDMNDQEEGIETTICMDDSQFQCGGRTSESEQELKDYDKEVEVIRSWTKQGRQAWRRMPILVLLAVVVVMAGVLSLSVIWPSSEKKRKTSESSSLRLALTTSPPCSPVESLSPDPSPSQSLRTLSPTFAMVLSPFLNQGFLNEIDLLLWHDATRQHLQWMGKDCIFREVIPSGQSFVPLLNQSLEIEFTIDGECGNSTNSVSATESDESLSMVEALSLAWNNDTEISSYISILQIKSESFQGILDITVEVLDTDEIDVSINSNTTVYMESAGGALPISVVVASLSNAPSSSSSASLTAAPGMSLTSAPGTTTQPSAPSTAPIIPNFSIWGSYELITKVPHDADAMTQGLGKIPGNSVEYFESTGGYGSSSIRRVNLTSGEVLQQQNLASNYFGGGLTYYVDEGGNERLMQLTWKEGLVLRYDGNTLGLIAEQWMASSTTTGQGWGICHVASEDIFYVTDGTQYLHKWNTTTLELIDQITVTLRDTVDSPLQEQFQLNELEWDIHSGTVLANVLQESFIVRIDPSTGFVTRRYSLSELVEENSDRDVLNGIAITDVPNEIWVTGKGWPYMYLIRLND